MVQLPNCWPFAVLTLGCLRAGLVPVIALPAHRQHELAYLCQHSEARALAVPGVLRGFDHQDMAARLPGYLAVRRPGGHACLAGPGRRVRGHRGRRRHDHRRRARRGPALAGVFGMAEGLLNYTRLDDPDEVICGTQGRPLSSGDEVRIVDADGRDLPDGEPGALLTRSPYTPRGYYRAPEQNARAFTPDGWYASGDVVRRRPDGNLVVEGRDKDMINRGGEKISVTLAAIRDAMATAGVARFKWPERLELMASYPSPR